MIKQLDQETTLQIAAGEVIERPRSIVKELLENSIDAGSDTITLNIERAGIASIRIQDNGKGIDKSDLQLALTRHATSKISDINDLKSVESMGFRGEALASIAAIAKIELTSKTACAEHAWKVTVEGSEACDLMPVQTAGLTGTSVVVTDLFFNTPVRKKFLASERTEFQYILEVFKRIALARPNVSFKLIHNQKLHTQLHKEQSELDRLSILLSKDFGKACESVQASDSQIKLSGWIAKPSYTRAQSDQQYLFLNRRFIKDKGLYHAVKRAYHDVLHGDRVPAFVLYLEIQPEVVDVNVHPTKEQVRFQQPQPIYQIIKRCIEHKLNQRMLEPVTPEPTLSHPNQAKVATQSVVERAFQPQPFPISPKPFSPPATQLNNMQTISEKHEPYKKPTIPIDTQIKVDIKPPTPLGNAIGQIGHIYILAENKDGLIIVDMHAAHERILYEALKTSYAEQGIISQALLLPVSLTLPEDKIECLETNALFFEQIGFKTKVVGENQAQVTHIPMLLKDAAINELVESVVAEFTQHQDTVNKAVNHILSTMACHNAIRAGKRLSIHEMDTLLRQIETTEKSEFCNHGRPTWQSISVHALDKMFKRGQ